MVRAFLLMFIPPPTCAIVHAPNARTRGGGAQTNIMGGESGPHAAPCQQLALRQPTSANTPPETKPSKSLFFTFLQGWPVLSELNPTPVQPKDASTQAVMRFTSTAAPSAQGPLAVFTTTANGPEEMFFMWDATAAQLYYDSTYNRYLMANDLVCALFVCVCVVVRVCAPGPSAKCPALAPAVIRALTD